jgi:hypothetical protein
MMRFSKLMIVVMTVLMIVSLSGCYSVYTGQRYQLGEEQSEGGNTVADGVSVPLFYGYGTGASRSAAQDDAIGDALQRAASLALGDSGMIYREQIERLIAAEVNVRSFILTSTLDEIDWDYDNGTYSVLISARLLLPELSKLLQSRGILGGLIDTSITLRLPDQQPLDYQQQAALSDVLGPVGPDWSSGYKPTFLVYYDEQQVSDPFTARTAVLSANSYLSSIGFTYIDLKQIESVKLDQEYAYTEETGGTSMLRWIASRLHADYYIDVAVSTSSYARGGSYYADSSVSLSIFNASTAEGRGSSFIQTNEPVQANTRSSALERAVAEGVEKGMYDIMSKASAYFTSDAQRGSSYELIIMKTYDDKVMRAFQQVLAARVGSLQRTSFSVEESRYAVTFSGTIDEFADLVYEAALQFSELQGLYLVYQRGDSLTFHSGQ